jgi:hypothetical protein
VEKELELEHALRRVHVLVVDDPAHRGLVHAESLATSRSTSGPGTDPVVEELALEIDDAVGDLLNVFCRWSTDLISHSADRNLSFT